MQIYRTLAQITPSIQLNSTLSPYSLYLLPSRRIHVVCQTQHLRYFIRGPHPSSFSSFPSSLLLPDPQVTTRYVDLQPVGMGASNLSSISSPIPLLSTFKGAFGLVWYVSPRHRPPSLSPPTHMCLVQFGKRSTNRRIRRHQEDHETIQHACPLQAHLPRAQTPQAYPT